MERPYTSDVAYLWRTSRSSDELHTRVRQAARRTQAGWVKGAFGDGGSVCAIGALLESLYGDAHVRPLTIRADSEYARALLALDRQLSGSWIYRRFRAAGVRRGETRLDAIERAVAGWNDALWRRKSSVVQALRESADTLELHSLRRRHRTLLERITALQAENLQLRAEVDGLRAENRFWQRRWAARKAREVEQRLTANEAELVGATREVSTVWSRLPELQHRDD